MYYRRFSTIGIIITMVTLCESFLETLPVQQRLQTSKSDSPLLLSSSSTLLPLSIPHRTWHSSKDSDSVLDTPSRSLIGAAATLPRFASFEETTATVNNRSYCASTSNSRRRSPRRRMIGDTLVSSTGNSYIGYVPKKHFTTTKSNPTSVATFELYCSAINPCESEIEENKNKNNPTIVSSWKDNLLKFSTMASILCVIDCTVLPILTLLLPLLGMVSAVNTLLPLNHLIHHVGHQITIYFVLPIGFFATTTNYLLNHRKKWILSIGWFGLLLVLAANTGGGCSTIVEQVQTHTHAHVMTSHHNTLSALDGTITFLSQLLHIIQHGTYHRIVNLTGCAFLIASNYISHKYQGTHAHSAKGHLHGENCCPKPPIAIIANDGTGTTSPPV
jgi:MerC mercury resistance protein